MTTYSLPYAKSTDTELNEVAHRAATLRLRDARVLLDREFGPGFAVASSSPHLRQFVGRRE